MKRPILHRAAAGLAALAVRALPDPLKAWGQAMAHEVDAIEGGTDALSFALGCAGFALFENIRFQLFRPATDIDAHQEADMMFSGDDTSDPRRFAAVCGTLATGLGLAWMATAGAPLRYLAINAGALMLGLAILLALVMTARSLRIAEGGVAIVLAAGLLFTASFGATVNGATRWIILGGLSIQPSLILLPSIVLCFARTRDTLSAIGIALAALALAIQPDRGMSGALFAGVAALALVSRQWSVRFALAAAAMGFLAAMARPDVQPAMPFVDRILFTAFDVHPVAGLVVVAGSGLLVLPGLLGFFRDPGNSAIHIVFGTVWLAIVAAAALGNYPTPLVGFGGSAIIGYFIGIAGLPTARARDAASPGIEDGILPTERDVLPFAVQRTGSA